VDLIFDKPGFVVHTLKYINLTDELQGVGEIGDWVEFRTPGLLGQKPKTSETEIAL
jgi:hypothetical protein